MMSLDDKATKPHDRLAQALAADMDQVNALIRARMSSGRVFRSGKG